MPDGFRRHLVGKTLRNVCHCDIAKNTLCWQTSDHTDIFVNQRIGFYLNNTTNLRFLTPHSTLYPQNGDRFVATDSVTSLHLIYAIRYSTSNVRSKTDRNQCHRNVQKVQGKDDLVRPICRPNRWIFFANELNLATPKHARQHLLLRNLSLLPVLNINDATIAECRFRYRVHRVKLRQHTSVVLFV